MMPSLFHRAVLIFVCLLALASPTVIAGGGPTGVVVVYNPNDPRSVTIANEYQQVRGIPERNMVPYAFPTVFSRTTALDFVYSLRATLKARGLEPQLQSIALAGVTPLSSRTTSPSINSVSLHSFLYMSPNYSYASAPTFPIWNTAYANPAAINGPAPNGTVALTATTTYEGMRYWPVSSIGFPGKGGNSLREILGFIARAKARDGLKPTGGTVYWPLNSDVRAGARVHEIDDVKDVWHLRGIRYQVTIVGEAWVSDRADIQGGVVGTIHFTDRGNTYFPGAWVDHLTSTGGDLESIAGQDPCSKWLRAGADGSSGTMSEPMANPDKFPHAHIHTHLRAGASLVEAFWQSIRLPAEIICLGDPLLQTFADFPNVSLTAPAEGATVSGNVLIAATAAPTGGKTLEPHLDLFIDGRRIAIGQAGETISATRTVGGFSVNTATLGDGWHEVRVVAYNNDSVRTQNEAVRTIKVSNAGQSLALNGPATVNPDGNATFTVTPVGLGDLTSLTLQANGRTLATLPTSGGSANISGSLAPLANKWSVYAVGTRSNGQQVWSAPFSTTVDWPAQPAATNVALGGAQANVRYFNSTNGTGFNWDTSTPNVTTTFTGNDKTGGLSLTRTNIPGITFNSTTVESLKPGYEVKCWFYAPTDDFYEVTVLNLAYNNSAKASVAIDGVTLPQYDYVFGPRRLSPGWHELRIRATLTVNNWTSTQVRLRGGSSQGFSLIIPSVSASMGTGSPATTPQILSITPSTSPVTTTNVTLTANATIGGGTPAERAGLTYHWSQLSGPKPVTFSVTGAAGQPVTTAKFTQTGNYVFGLRVAGATDSAFTTIPVTVQAHALTMVLSTNGYTDWLRGLPLNVSAYSKDQFGSRIDITPTVPGQPTVNWTSTDPNGSFQNISANGETAQFVSLSALTANATCKLTATGTNGRTGSATTPNLTIATNASPKALFSIAQSGNTTAITFTNGFRTTTLDSPIALRTYHWSVVSTPPGGTLALGANGGTKISGIASAPGYYTVRHDVTDHAGTTASQTLTFHVDGAGAVTTQAALNNQTRHVGQSVFYQKSFPHGDQTYQWQTSSDGGASWQNLSGTTTSESGLDKITMNYGPVTTADNGRQFRLNIARSGGVLTGLPSTITVVNPVGGTIRIDSILSTREEDIEIPENAGSTTFTIRRVGGSSGAASAKWSISAIRDAEKGVDFLAPNGTANGPYSGNLTWADGDSSDRLITVPIVNDTLAEDSNFEYFQFNIHSATGASIGPVGNTKGNESLDNCYILDDDNVGQAEFRAHTATVTESAGSITLPVQRLNSFAGNLTVNYTTQSQTAAAGQDFTAVSGTLTWTNGDTADKQIVVPILSDNLVEGGETFTVTLTAPDTTPSSLGLNNACTVTIKDAPYQQWQKAWWPSAIPALPLFFDYETALRSLSPLVRFPLNETSGPTVAISAATSGASIRYTTDGSTPTSTSGTLYTSPLTISATTTLKAIAYKSGMNDSAVSTGVYTISDGGNIALNKPASASSRYDAAYGPNFGNDGITSDGNGWASASGAAADWWQVDLGSAFNINRVELVSRQNVDQPATRRNYEVRASNNADMSNYVVLATTGSTAFAHQGTWSAAVSNSNSYRYLRVAKTIPESSFLAEFRAYGFASIVTAPTFSAATGTYASAQPVTISSTTSGATIRYTTDGSTPSATVGTVYTSPVNIASTATLKAIAYMSGMTDSAVTTGDYIIGGSNAVAAPTFSPAAGTYLSTQTVAGVDATGTTVANGNLTKTGTGGNYTLAQAGPRPSLWPGLESGNTALSFTTGTAVTSTPPRYTAGASVNCGAANGLGSMLGSGFTISMFVKTSVTDREMTLVGGKRLGGLPTTFFVSLNHASNNNTACVPHAVRIYISPQGVNYKKLDFSIPMQNLPTGSICDGQWHHLAITVPELPSFGTTNYTRFYFDGVEVNTLDARGGNGFDIEATFSDFSDTGFRIGSDGSATPISFFNGALDEVAFIPRVLTAAEIANLCAAQPPTTPPAYTAAAANPTGDGVPNLMKYALGLSPLTHASGADLPSIQPQTNSVDFNFTRRRDATDIIYQVERRWDLMSGSWTEVYSSSGDPFGSTDPSMTESLNFDLQGNPKAFFRLKITRP
jgi:hypothetical protein